MAIPPNSDSPRTWQDIAHELSRETDTDKAMQLAEELNKALAERDSHRNVKALNNL